jgi:hypothetical protein
MRAAGRVLGFMTSAFALLAGAVALTPDDRLTWLRSRSPRRVLRHRVGEPCSRSPASPAVRTAGLALDGIDESMPSANAELSEKANPGLERAFRFPQDPVEQERTALRTVTTALALGAEVNVANQNGDTAIHVAVNREFDSVLQALAGAGADLQLINNCGGRLRSRPRRAWAATRRWNCFASSVRRTRTNWNGKSV